MTKNNIKLPLFVIATLAVLIASPMAISAIQVEAQTETITRYISDEEFREAQNKVLDFRSEQNALEKLSNTSEDRSALDGEIAKLMPILDKHQEQNFAKHYIEPQRKALMESVENDLRNNISEMYKDNSDNGSFIVNLDTLTKEIKVSTSSPQYNDEIKRIISQYPSDIPVVFGNHDKIEIIDFACANQTDDCDPIVGGIEIEGDCTLGLPVKKGWWPFQTDGYVTAGHCIADNADLNQPDAGSPKIGDNTDSRNNPDCDCAFVEEDTSTTTYSQVWRSSNNYLTVSNEGGSRPSAGSDITISGKTNGFLFGEIVTPNLVFTVGSTTYDWLEHDVSSTSGGDSGGPIGDSDFSDIEGIVKGQVTITGGGPLNGVHYIGSAWEELDSDFTLSLQ